MERLSADCGKRETEKSKTLPRKAQGIIQDDDGTGLRSLWKVN